MSLKLLISNKEAIFGFVIDILIIEFCGVQSSSQSIPFLVNSLQDRRLLDCQQLTIFSATLTIESAKFINPEESQHGSSKCWYHYTFLIVTDPSKKIVVIKTVYVVLLIKFSSCWLC